MDKSAIQRQIDAMGRRIDNLVFELYGLVEEEIVKEANGKGVLRVASFHERRAGSQWRTRP